jgi:3-hydroxyacyl-CoA dehydrogenase
VAVVSCVLAAVFILAALCLAYGYTDGSDLDDAVGSTAGTFGGIAMAGDLTGWLIYLAV